MSKDSNFRNYSAPAPAYDTDDTECRLERLESETSQLTCEDLKLGNYRDSLISSDTVRSERSEKLADNKKLLTSTISFEEEVVFGIDLNHASPSASPCSDRASPCSGSPAEEGKDGEEGEEGDKGATMIRFDERQSVERIFLPSINFRISEEV